MLTKKNYCGKMYVTNVMPKYIMLYEYNKIHKKENSQ